MLRRQIAGVAVVTNRRSGPGGMPAHPREGDRGLPTTTTTRITRIVGVRPRAPGTDKRRVLPLPPLALPE
jgi:hypothetical protein